MTARWITADVFDGLATLETGSVDLVVSSPPFLALRSYLPADHSDKHKEIGSEATPAEFIDVLLKVTAELRRVLAPHGSICVELGDTYSGKSGWGDDEGNIRYPNGRGVNGSRPDASGPGWPLTKSLSLVPQLYEIALAYGVNPLTGSSSPAGQWRIRNVVTWARPNPPVGALGDKWRPATSDLIVACVSPKRYWDDLATRKQVKPHTAKYDGQRGDGPKKGNPNRVDGGLIEYGGSHPSGAPLLDYWEIPLLEGEELKQYGPASPKPYSREQNAERVTPPGQRPRLVDDATNPAGAPLLDYWEIPPGGYKGSHYAVMPEELVVPCVKAMAPEKVCRVCGEPSRRIVEQTNEAYAEAMRLKHQLRNPSSEVGLTGYTKDNKAASVIANGVVRPTLTTTGWTDCGHDDYRPGLVLDPFAGSGTTLSVATGHGHDAIGIDLDPRNADLARDRIGPFLFEETRML